MTKFSFLLTCLIAVSAGILSDSALAQRPQRGEDGAPSTREGRGGGRGFGVRGGDRARGGFGGRPGGMRGGPMGGAPELALLRSAEVRQELEVMPDQAEALQKIEKRGEERPRGPAEGFDFRNASEDERAEMFKKMQTMREEVAKEQKELLKEVLFPEQIERLDQLMLQMRGIMALGEPDVQERLGMTTTQVDKLKQIRSDQETKMRDSMREIWQSGDREGIRDKMTEMRKDVESKVLEQLDPKQKEKFESMKGKPFDFSAIRPPEGRGGGRDEGGRRGRPERSPEQE